MHRVLHVILASIAAVSALGRPPFTEQGAVVLGGLSVDARSASFADHDNGGDLDLFAQGHVPLGGRNIARVLCRSDGNWEFTHVTWAEGLPASNEGAFDCAWADFDLGGDLGLGALTRFGYPEWFSVNSASANGDHWLQVRLVGTRENTTAIGARLCAAINAGTPDERTLRRDAHANAGTFHQSDPPVRFGLGAERVGDRPRIFWPDGQEQVLTEVAADQFLTVEIPPLTAVPLH